MTIRHVVSFTWNSDVPADQAEQFSAALAKLPDLIPEIRSYRFGADLGLVDGNSDYAVVADFDDAAGFHAYRDHPDHQQLIADHVAGKIESRAAVQFEL